MQVAKWGNSLAVRIPADVVRTLGLKDGDEIDLHALDDGTIAVITERQRREAALDRLTKMAVKFPEDYVFDREEANAR
ncbi:AbrB/MazE/SpoVT family DNA-binding domain-containing protein [Sphingomonas bacterium]|uniref:AbrB/MazE/SpoVT family DNA-binding domain-containing protein n=1 Tax=Sphingomonas bacterium TaxID=1895847 RepID=UPI001575ACCC|nr:AbrB/MazE/SpoVT family DNA-binding domain-containing protein [Sphingomonas bacterium]